MGLSGAGGWEYAGAAAVPAWGGVLGGEGRGHVDDGGVAARGCLGVLDAVEHGQAQVLGAALLGRDAWRGFGEQQTELEGCTTVREAIQGPARVAAGYR